MSPAERWRRRWFRDRRQSAFLNPRRSRRSRQTVPVDWRVKNFDASARQAFAFLTDAGFTVGTEWPADVHRRPISLRVNFIGAETRVEASLSLGLGGEDYLQTRVVAVDGTSDLEPIIARKGHELRKALGSHGRQTKVLLKIG